MSSARRNLMFQRGEATFLAILLLLVIMAISWVLWSGIYKPLVLGLGAFSCVLATYMGYRMGFFRHHALLTLLPRLPGYWLWLLREIVISSIDVAKIILSPSMPISTAMVSLKAATQTDVGLVILGNSITLSPGTVTVDVHEGQLLVHCLTSEGAHALKGGEANRRAAYLEPG